ncbi:serine/threonine protein kinase, CMGC, CDC2/CDK sub [Rhizophlyctis rosea]|uniref:Serine/threonine protein kinase, CMGC, CDC2/CDK sub n=1 Tax=Rhizophlyctis rosea TaxID=64517 RepID=A0AAD5SHC0_9FUNG|nr:serine/threonine protein kinase, CMGC, CDC2/CDK sub [Rhizophlyctis rosea]
MAGEGDPMELTPSVEKSKELQPAELANESTAPIVQQLQQQPGTPEPATGSKRSRDEEGEADDGEHKDITIAGDVGYAERAAKRVKTEDPPKAEEPSGVEAGEILSPKDEEGEKDMGPPSPASERSPLPAVPQAPRHETQYAEQTNDQADEGPEPGELEEGEVLSGGESASVEPTPNGKTLKPPRDLYATSAPTSPYVPLQSPMGDQSRPHDSARTYSGCSHVSDYEGDTKIGEGTFGIVTIAKHKHKPGKFFALKEIQMHDAKEGIPITALREIKILKSLSHPNVINLCEMAYSEGNKQQKTNGKIFMVFPYMDHDLTGLLDNRNIQLTPAQIKSFMKQILEGTAYLHRSNILHRDMKSANILVGNDGTLKLADFGLARTWLRQAQQRLTPTVVTRWYRPPELFFNEKNEHYTEAVDMWGVGCVFGEMWKRRPILAAEEHDQLDKILELVGTPTDQNWPNWRNHELFKGPAALSFKPRPSTLHERFPEHHYDRQTVSLLERLLQLNPATRLSAEQALNHEYFRTEPEAAVVGSPAFTDCKWTSSHELAVRANAKDTRDRPAHHDAFKDKNGRILPRRAIQPKGDRSGRNQSGSGGGGRNNGSNVDRYVPSYDSRDNDRDRDRDGDHWRPDSRPANRGGPQTHPLPPKPSPSK